MHTSASRKWLCAQKNWECTAIHEYVQMNGAGDWWCYKRSQNTGVVKKGLGDIQTALSLTIFLISPFFPLILLEHVPRNDRLITIPALYLFHSHLFVCIILLVWECVAIQPWMSWILFCSPDWPQTHSMPLAETIGMHHHACLCVRACIWKRISRSLVWPRTHCVAEDASELLILLPPPP